jgi:acyl carrier protein
MSKTAVNKQQLVDMMTGLLQIALDSHRQEEGNESAPDKAQADMPLIGDNAVVTSMALVSFVADVESTLQDEHDLTVTLVSEQSLSRKRSPFRTVETLADYIVELIDGPTEA